MALVVIERKSSGALSVLTEPGLPGLDRTLFLPICSNKRFSFAAGYAVTIAVLHGYELVDRTGRLSPAQCAALVKAKRAEKYAAALQ